MMVFAGLPVKITDAVFADHINVERMAIFCGREAFATVAALVRNPGMADFVSVAFHESIRTKRSVKVTTIEPGMAYPVRL